MKRWLSRWLLTAVAALASVGLAHQASDAHPGRLVVADARDGSLKVLDLETGQVVGTFSSPGPASVYPAEGTPYAFAIHREANRVSVVYTGLRLEDHGEHKDLLLEKPYVFATLNTGPKPTHYFNHGHHAAIFNDGDGTVAVFDTRRLGVVADLELYATGSPGHGALEMMDDVLITGLLHRGVVEVYALPGGRKVQEFPGCPRLHGSAALGKVAAFGCADGVLLLERRGDGFAARKLANPPGSPADARVGALRAQEAHPFFIGNFGQGLARIDPRGYTFTPYPLPARPMRFEFSADGLHLVVLTADGRLHVLEPASGRVLRSLEVVGPVLDGAGPSLVVGTEYAYVSDPEKGVVHEIELDDLQVRRRFEVGGTPRSLALVRLEGMRH